MLQFRVLFHNFHLNRNIM